MNYDYTIRPLHILLADDDEDDRLLFKEAFRELRIKTEVKTVNDGDELMDYLKDENSSLPNVLFLDINMPGKNGIDCLDEIRKSRKLKHLPVAMYSTSSSKKDIETTLLKGADIYITKPNDFESLKRVLNHVALINWQYREGALNKEFFLLSV